MTDDKPKNVMVRTATYERILNRFAQAEMLLQRALLVIGTDAPLLRHDIERFLEESGA